MWYHLHPSKKNVGIESMVSMNLALFKAKKRVPIPASDYMVNR